MSTNRLFATLILGGVLLAQPSLSSAYVRTKTCDPAGLDGPYCAPEQSALPVRWRSACVTYLVNARGSDDFPRLLGALKPTLDETLRSAIRGSAEAWSREECAGIALVYGGVTCSDEVSSTPTQLRARNINLIIFQEDEWAYPADAIALTTLSADTRSGEILDADIELNGVDYDFEEVTTSGSSAMDVRNTMTHEFGHLLGFAHEADLPEATMYPNADPGETSKRNLHEDDVAALCDVYPITESTPLACQPSLPQQDETCAIIMDGQTACAQVPGRAAPTGGAWPWVVALLGAQSVRKRIFAKPRSGR